MKDLLAPHSDRMLALCREVARDTTAPESLMARALGLVRDLALTQGDLGARWTGWRTCWPGGGGLGGRHKEPGQLDEDRGREGDGGNLYCEEGEDGGGGEGQGEQHEGDCAQQAVCDPGD